MDFLKVSSKSSPASVAGAIAGLIKDGNPVRIQSVGAGAVNQAVKAIAIARGYLIPTGVDVSCTPSFAEIAINGEVRTAIRFNVDPHLVEGGTLTPDELQSVVSSVANAGSAQRA
ncbi:MAG: stage V sporulation protein S [Coriobacteriales bacterium]